MVLLPQRKRRVLLIDIYDGSSTFQISYPRIIVKRFSILVIVLLASFLFVNRAEGQKVRVTQSSSTEAKLAVIDAGSSYVEQSVIDVYGRYLDKLRPKCNDNRTGISDTVVKATRILAKKGIELSALEFLVALDGSIPPEIGKMNCVEISAALITLIESG